MDFQSSCQTANLNCGIKQDRILSYEGISSTVLFRKIEFLVFCAVPAEFGTKILVIEIADYFMDFIIRDNPEVGCHVVSEVDNFKYVQSSVIYLVDFHQVNITFADCFLVHFNRACLRIIPVVRLSLPHTVRVLAWRILLLGLPEFLQFLIHPWCGQQECKEQQG